MDFSGKLGGKEWKEKNILLLLVRSTLRDRRDEEEEALGKIEWLQTESGLKRGKWMQISSEIHFCPFHSLFPFAFHLVHPNSQPQEALKISGKWSEGKCLGGLPFPQGVKEESK